MLTRLKGHISQVPLVLSVNQYARLQSPSVVPIDVSWHMPATKRDPLNEYRTKRLPRARFLDLDEVASHDHPLGLPHMMPTATSFAHACQLLGVTRESHVVLYDSVGVFSAPRALFTFKAFGHEKASILNGGLPAWQLSGYPLEEEESIPTAIIPTTYAEDKVILNNSMIRTYEQMINNLSSSPSDDDTVELVLDARPALRFNGTAPEPRPGLRSGHIPHSFSVPFSQLLEEHHSSSGSPYTTLKEPKELHQVLENILSAKGNIEGALGRRLVSTCGSGMTAAIIWLALQRIGINSSIYDESWMGYAARASSPVETV